MVGCEDCGAYDGLSKEHFVKAGDHLFHVLHLFFCVFPIERAKIPAIVRVGELEIVKMRLESVRNAAQFKIRFHYRSPC